MISGRKSAIALSIVSYFRISPIYAFTLDDSNFYLQFSDVVNPATSCPSSINLLVNFVPIKPVAPVTKILLIFSPFLYFSIRGIFLLVR